MRALLLFLLLGAVAVAVALFARVNDAGYVLVVAPPYRLEVSLNAFIVLVVAAFGALYALLRFASRLSRLPQEVRARIAACSTSSVRARDRMRR